MGMKGFTKIVIPITTVLLSGILSWLIARDTANEVLQGKLDQGQAVFENIGVRYFYALYSIHEYDEEKGAYGPSKDQKVVKSYLLSLADIQETIAWLITNPIYSEAQNTVRDFSLVQNNLAEEIVSREVASMRATALMRATRILMCSIYSERLQGILTEKNRSGYEKDVVEFAKKICQRG